MFQCLRGGKLIFNNSYLYDTRSIRIAHSIHVFENDIDVDGLGLVFFLAVKNDEAPFLAGERLRRAGSPPWCSQAETASICTFSMPGLVNSKNMVRFSPFFTSRVQPVFYPSLTNT